MSISVVLPVYNEEDNLKPLFKELRKVLENNYTDWEVIFVDDGSTDSTSEKLSKIREQNSNVKVIRLKTNFGQTPAIQAGIDNCKGDLVVTMDSDMQNDPRDIPKLQQHMETTGSDIVNGWRKNREDPFTKKLLSKVAAKVRRAFLGTDLHDYGCTLKIMEKEAAKELDLNGEMHRYVPPLLKMKGYKVTEKPVNHRSRNAGETKYGYQRLPKGFMDLLNVWFWQKYEGRPLHIFGGLGLLSITLGALMSLYTLYQKFVEGISISDTGATIISVFLVLVGVQFFISGIMTDILIKNHKQVSSHQSYYVEELK